MKRFILLSAAFLSLAVLASCKPAPTITPTPAVPETSQPPVSAPSVPAEQETAEPVAVAVPDVPAVANEQGSMVKTFEMTAKQFEFIPSTITVNQGDTVKLSITSTDVAHGLALPDFNVDVKVGPNETAQAEFVADKKGTFTFYCNVMCGEGHRDMKGTLIVQ